MHVYLSIPHWPLFPLSNSIADNFKFISGQLSRGYLLRILNALHLWWMFWSMGLARRNGLGGWGQGRLLPRSGIRLTSLKIIKVENWKILVKLQMNTVRIWRGYLFIIHKSEWLSNLVRMSALWSNIKDFVNLKSNSTLLYKKGHNLLTRAFPKKMIYYLPISIL